MSTNAPTALPFVQPAVPSGPRIDRETYQRLAKRVRLLSWASLAYMTLEGGIAIFAGILAGSVALVGFGIDSAIGIQFFISRPTSASSRSKPWSKASARTSPGLASR